MPTVGKAITMKIIVFQSTLKLFLNPTGAGYNIETRQGRGERGEGTVHHQNMSANVSLSFRE